jgi:polyhydroxyalkanoate synthesis regulator phasin
MYKEATYKQKFADLKEWIPLLIDSVKKDLRNEHLKKDIYFVKRFLSSKNIHKVTTEELVEAYEKAIQEEEKGEELAEFITSRWLINNSELYNFFEEQLSKINPDFASIEVMSAPQAQALIKASVDQFGAPQTYLFSVLNSVVFPKESFQSLRAQAVKDHEENEKETKQALEHLSGEQMRKEFEREIARLTDKYEKKLSGLQKKYVNDIDALKKQVAQLQRKIQPAK